MYSANHYSHPHGFYSYHIKDGFVRLSIDGRMLAKFLSAREGTMLQDLIKMSSYDDCVVIRPARYLQALGVATPWIKRGHMVWLRAFNRFFLNAANIRQSKPKTEVLALRCNPRGYVMEFCEVPDVGVPVFKYVTPPWRNQDRGNGHADNQERAKTRNTSTARASERSKAGGSARVWGQRGGQLDSVEQRPEARP